MPRHRRLACAAFFALLMLAPASAAQANSISISDSGFRATWSEFTLTGGGAVIRCPLTLDGSFHTTSFAKTRGSLMGYITRATLGACREREVSRTASVLTASLPWHFTYRGFTGTLPEITGIEFNMIGMSMLVEPGFGTSCLYRTTTASPAVTTIEVRRSGVEVTALRADESATRISLWSGGFLCPTVASLAAASNVTILGEIRAPEAVQVPANQQPLEIQPEPINIPNEQVSTNVTIRNIGAVAVTLNSVAVTGTWQAAYSESGACDGRVLAVNETCTLSVMWHEEARIIRARRAWLTITHTPAGGGPLWRSVALTG